MEADFRTILTTEPDITDLVPAERIGYQDNSQGKDNPRITYQVVSSIPHEELEGESGYTRFRVQVDVWADTDADLVAVVKAVTNRLRGFEGMVGSTKFAGIFRLNRRDQPARPVNGNEHGERRVSLEWSVHVIE